MTHKNPRPGPAPGATAAAVAAPATAPAARQRYRVLVGISYPTDPRLVAAKLRGDRIAEVDYITVRREIGALVTDIPDVCLPWMVAQGIIEPVGATPAPAPQPDEEAA